MSIRWRLSVLFIQIFILLYITNHITGRLYSSETWFFAGLLALVINPQLLEPFYPKPVDVIANSIIYLFLYLTASKTKAINGWNFFLIFLLIAFLFALIAIVLGSNKNNNKYQNIAKASRTLTSISSANLIYSGVFILSIIEDYPNFNADFWNLIISWAIILIIGKTNWQYVFAQATGRKINCRVEGMIGPNILLLSASELPDQGSYLTLSCGSLNTSGFVLSRIKRISDTWGKIYITNKIECEKILTSPTLYITKNEDMNNDIVGTVDMSAKQAVPFLSG